MAIVALLLPTGAAGRTITVGSPLRGQFTVNNTYLFPSVTLANSVLADPEANPVSPVDGIVVRWRLVPQGAADAFALRVLRPAGNGSYTGAGTSTAQFASTTEGQTFPTNLPIKAGDLIGIDPLKANPTIRVAAVLNSQPFWGPRLADGVTTPPSNVAGGVEYGFNAEVQPAPRVVLVGPSSGGTGGGTSVTVAGSDFTGVTGVRFGSVPAASFAVASESQITATAPAVVAPGPVDVTVTTAAGTSPTVAGDVFTYNAPQVPAVAPTPPASPPAPTCAVPNITSKSVKGARKALSRAKCKLGNVRGENGPGTKVVKQTPKAGTIRPAGSAVSVKLG